MHVVTVNCAQIIQFAAAELRKQLQNSARYEIRVSISQPPIFCFHFSALSFATSFLHVSIPQCSISSAAAPLRIRTSTLSILVSVVYSHLSPKRTIFFICRSHFCYQKPCTALHSLAQHCTALHSLAQSSAMLSHNFH